MEDKKTIVILHGWEGSPKNWQNVSNLLKEKNLEEKIPYLPGFDKEKPLKHPYTLNDYSLWLKDFLDQNNLKKIVLIGHSNGGRIAGFFTAGHPDRVKKLILIASAGLPPKNNFKKFVFKTLSQFGKFFSKITNNKKLILFSQKLLYKLARESDYLNADPIMKKTMINLLACDLTNYFAKIKCPALCVWGENDNYTPLWMGEKINSLIKNSKLVVIARARHGIHLTHPKKLSELIIKFIIRA